MVSKEMLDYFKELMTNPPKDLIESFNETKNIDLNYKELFPCFFTGDISRKNLIVTISLNPKIDSGGVKVKQSEQGTDFNKWIENCVKGFDGYQDVKKLHLVWKNLYKVLSGEMNLDGSKKPIDFLQTNIVNLDWCYHYSSNFPTLSSSELNNSPRRDLYAIYDTNLEKLINEIKPKVIFIHGKSFNEWVNINCTEIKEELELSHGSKKYKVKSCFYKKTKVPVIYQEWFINKGNANVNLEKVNKLINRIIKENQCQN